VANCSDPESRIWHSIQAFYAAGTNRSQVANPSNKHDIQSRYERELYNDAGAFASMELCGLFMIPPESISVSISTFSLIALAEVGDKSQVVCMTLAARHRHWPVILGATTAFFALNALAVLFGAGIAAWVPERVIAGLVAIVFGAYGLHALYRQDIGKPEDVAERSGNSIFLTTLLMIFVAEFGDKTQIAVAGLASSFDPLPVWLGATAALVMVSVFAVLVGRTLLQRLPLNVLHRASGVIFLLFAALATWRALA
jgi:putative Ca2+/H+ antiporter (TMEM165/GDT1 family)